MAIGRHLSDKNPDGTCLGQLTSDKISFYGTTPIVQRSGATQATSLVSVTSASFATAYAAALLEIMNTLQAVGLWKGEA